MAYSSNRIDENSRARSVLVINDSTLGRLTYSSDRALAALLTTLPEGRPACRLRAEARVRPEFVNSSRSASSKSCRLRPHRTRRIPVRDRVSNLGSGSSIGRAQTPGIDRAVRLCMRLRFPNSGFDQAIALERLDCQTGLDENHFAHNSQRSRRWILNEVDVGFSTKSTLNSLIN